MKCVTNGSRVLQTKNRIKKVFSVLLLLVFALGLLPIFVAATESQAFQFQLTVDGSETKYVSTGDVITVVLHLKRTDRAENYTMYAMQDEIRYDSQFFELVDGSTILSNGIQSNDIGMRDAYREIYMNFLSTSGGTIWEPDMLIGSFQLRVIADSGMTKITNQDYLVSTKDGFGHFPCIANELTIILSADCMVRFESNGGSSVEDQIVPYGEKLVEPEDPVREGYTFSGWYSDIDKTTPWDFENDTVSGNLVLYASWIEGEAHPVPGGATNDGECNWWLLILLGILLLLIIIVLLLPRNKVSFNTMGGAIVKAKYVFRNSKLKKPRNPILHRKVFGGWYKDAACTNPWNFATDKVKEDITLYAKWY